VAKKQSQSKPILRLCSGQVYQRSMFCVQRTASRWGRMDDGRLSTRQSSLVLSCFDPASSGGREAKNCSKHLSNIVRNICLIRGLWQFSAKKGCILRAVRIQYTISEAFSGRPIRTSYSRIVGLLEVSDYGRNVLFLTGSRRKTQSE